MWPESSNHLVNKQPTLFSAHINLHALYPMHPDTKEAADRCHAAMRKIKLAEEIRMQDRAINIMQADFAGFKQIVDLTEADDEVLNVPKAIVVDDIESEDENDVAAPSIELQFDSLAGHQYGFWIEVSSLSLLNEQRTIAPLHLPHDMLHLYNVSFAEAASMLLFVRSGNSTANSKCANP